MARIRLSLLLLGTVLVAGACDRAADGGQTSITVKLPPARPHTPAPAFSFKASGKQAAR